MFNSTMHTGVQEHGSGVPSTEESSLTCDTSTLSVVQSHAYKMIIPATILTTRRLTDYHIEVNFGKVLIW